MPARVWSGVNGRRSRPRAEPASPRRGNPRRSNPSRDDPAAATQPRQPSATQERTRRPDRHASASGTLAPIRSTAPS